MPVFLDTGFILAVKSLDDKNHNIAQTWMRRFLKNEFGQIFTSHYVFDELLTLALVRLERADLAMNLGEYILKSPRIHLVNVSDDDFNRAWAFFQQYIEKMLSFTDCCILAQCERLHCNLVATFDSHFHGLIGGIWQ
ncbi:MAG: putative nucleic acid-binding protein, contains PIN domain [Promethearchaeota archaeon CR_4]|nr:MAG: putative nucleic acid-binding protein, contains PIN domain [Candidatus Lokiarchaeota archaeon CR_4]